MVYGDATKTQNLAFGGAKTTVPASVNTALETATVFIDGMLNIDKELTGTDKPSWIDTIANLMAAGILQEQREPDVQSQNSIKANKLLESHLDDTTEVSRGESMYLGYVEP